MINGHIKWCKEEIVKSIVDHDTVPADAVSYLFKRSIYDPQKGMLTETEYFPDGKLKTVSKTADDSMEFTEYDSAGNLIADSRTIFHNPQDSGIYSTTYESGGSMSQEIHEYDDAGELSKQIFLSGDEKQAIEYKREGSRKITRHYINDVFQQSTEIEEDGNMIISTDYSDAGIFSGRTVVENNQDKITVYTKFGSDNNILSKSRYKNDDSDRVVSVSCIDQQNQLVYFAAWIYDNSSNLPECRLDQFSRNKKLYKEIKLTYSYEMPE